MSSKRFLRGQYDYADAPMERGRAMFLGAINRCAPEVYQELMRSVYPIYVGEQEVNSRSQNPVHLTSYKWYICQSLALHAPLRMALDDWGNSFNIGWEAFDSGNRGCLNSNLLGDDWIASQAMWGMWQYWKGIGNLRPQIGTGVSIDVQQDHEVNTVTLDCSFRQYVKQESLEDFESRVFAHLKKEFDRQVSDFARKAKLVGLREPPEDKPQLAKHMEWLTCWQAKKMSHQQICEHWREQKKTVVDNSTVAKGIRNAASLIKLNLRTADNGGRPRNP